MSSSPDTGVSSRFICCRVRIDGLGRDAAVAALLDSRYGQPRRTHLCNAYTLSLALREPRYRRMLNESDVNFADGHYVAVVGRRRGQPQMTERVYGPGMMLDTLDRGRDRGLRHYLYGAAPETVAALAESLRARLPGVRIVAAESPPFRPLTDAEERDLIGRVQELRPDIFWVGLGTPKQDWFVAEYTARLATTVVPVGAAFDFWAGTKPIAPALIRRYGMEWAYRLATEPRRLWKRYLIGNPLFVYGVLTDRRSQSG
ncbi:MAG TPA: WecB/TagA/CpsF family glycosyltransferase [Micromonosporaceae bacterium]